MTGTTIIPVQSAFSSQYKGIIIPDRESIQNSNKEKNMNLSQVKSFFQFAPVKFILSLFVLLIVIWVMTFKTSQSIQAKIDRSMEEQKTELIILEKRLSNKIFASIENNEQITVGEVKKHIDTSQADINNNIKTAQSDMFIRINALDIDLKNLYVVARSIDNKIGDDATALQNAITRIKSIQEQLENLKNTLIEKSSELQSVNQTTQLMLQGFNNATNDRINTLNGSINDVSFAVTKVNFKLSEHDKYTKTPFYQRVWNKINPAQLFSKKIHNVKLNK